METLWLVVDRLERELAELRADSEQRGRSIVRLQEQMRRVQLRTAERVPDVEVQGLVEELLAKPNERSRIRCLPN